MKKLHYVLRELIQFVRNATQQLSSAYQSTQPIFTEYQAYFKPYKDAFEVIGLVEELESDYFQYAAIPLIEEIQEDIAPLQAAAILCKLFNQESFFMLHEYSLLAFSQLTETSSIIKTLNLSNEAILLTQLGSVNWVTRFELLAIRLAEVINEEIKEEKNNKELVKIQNFVEKFAKISMLYLDSLKAFQTHVIAGERAGDHQRTINQILFDLNAKQTELNICRRKLETITTNLNGFWAKFYELDANLPVEVALLTQQISLLEQEEIPLLTLQLQQEHKNILMDLQKYRGELNELRKTIENLDAAICQKNRESVFIARSSTLAWKRAILADNAVYLKKLFEYGLNPQVVGSYLACVSQNNKAATLQQSQILAVLFTLGHLLFQSPSEIAAVRVSDCQEEIKQFKVAEEVEQKNMLVTSVNLEATSSNIDLPKTKKTAETTSYKSDTLKACSSAKLVSGQKSFFAQQLPLLPPTAGASKKIVVKTTSPIVAEKPPINFQR